MPQLVPARHPEVQMIVTHNAELNDPMLSINQRLGFATHRRNGHYQFDPESLRNFLALRSQSASRPENVR